MKKRINITGTLVLLFFVSALWGQSEYKEELRAPWVATVANIDWPISRNDNPDKQKADLIAMLDLYASMHMNAIFLQVRTECDALYQSSYEPWSRYVSGSQGDDPGYDPLAFALEEAHKRGIEVHAWMNPYRLNASSNPAASYFHSTHIYKEHPEWAIEYDNGKYILNPGLPEVMSYIGSVVRDMLENYAVDGVHFDDYFYAYGGTSNDLDQIEYDTYGNGMSRGDWRRDNVNRMIDTVYRVVQETLPAARFGVSPFGIWRPGNPTGIVGMDAYSSIYCDPMAWLEDKTVDYLTPQLYWPTGGGQDFESLANWWSDQVQIADRHFCPGHGTYRLDVNPGEKKSIDESPLHESKWYMDMNLSNMEQSLLKGTSDPVAAWTLGQIGLQIDIMRSNHDKGAKGSVFFSANDFFEVNGLADYMRENKYTHAVLAPEMTWKPDDTPAVPTNLRFELLDNEYILKWDSEISGNQRFAIYVENSQTSGAAMIANPASLQLISFDKDVAVPELTLYSSSYVTVTAVSATGRESAAPLPIPVPTLPKAELVNPDDGVIVADNTVMSWTSALSSPLYLLQVARKNIFNNIIYESSWTSQVEISVGDLELDGESEYFWRVRAKDDVTGVFTDPRSFTTGYPVMPELISPINLSQNISRTPTFNWSASSVTDEIVVQISANSSFDPVLVEESMPAQTGTGSLSTELEPETWYYARIAGRNTYGTSAYSALITFKTGLGNTPVVELLAPANQSNAASFDNLQWKTSDTQGSVAYEIRIAVDEAFANTIFTSGWMPGVELLIEDMKLEGKRSYYWRARAKDDFGAGEFTDPWSFTAAYPSRPSLSKPVHLSDGVSTRPTLEWSTDADTDSIYAEFSEDFDFNSPRLAETYDATPGSVQTTGSLKGNTYYYLRIKAINLFGRSIFSGLKYFETGDGTSIDPKNEDAGALKVYPSPLVDGILTISTTSYSSGSIQLSIIDQMGRQLSQEIFNSPSKGEEVQWKIPSGHLSGSGLYIVRVVQDGRSLSSQFVIN